MHTQHLTVKIETGNAAFGNGEVSDRDAELARILRELADRLEDGDYSEDVGGLRDFNGNKVGDWKIE